jgi:hypothetical protein
MKALVKRKLATHQTFEPEQKVRVTKSIFDSSFLRRQFNKGEEGTVVATPKGKTAQKGYTYVRWNDGQVTQFPASHLK